MGPYLFPKHGSYYGVRSEDDTVLNLFVMPAEAGIQKSKNSPGFPFPDFSRTSFTGMINVGNNSLAVSQTTDSLVMPHRRDLAAIFSWVYRENVRLLPKLVGPCIEEVHTVELGA